MSGTQNVMPFQPYAQKFSISLAGVTYNIRTYWNSQITSWFFDIADIDNNLIVSGLPFVTGADILSQFAYLGIGGSLIVLSSGNLLATPTLTNLGNESEMYFVTPA